MTEAFDLTHGGDVSMWGDEKQGLARAVRELRQEKGWTLAELSARTGIPSSTLSKVENGKLSLTYDKLVSLSRGMAVDITRLFSASVPAALPALAVQSARRSIDRAGGGHFIRTRSYDHHYLAADLLNKRIDPIIAELKARTLEEFGDWVRHPGEEFAYILNGEADLYTEFYSTIRLRAGDSVYFDSSMGHAYLAVGAPPSRVLSICTGGQFEILKALGLDPNAMLIAPNSIPGQRLE